MKRFRGKRILAIGLLAFLLILFYRSNWLGKMIYPIPYRQEIESSAAEFKVDPLLVASIIRVESNYKPQLRSKKGALGIMQVMPDTAEWIFEMDGFRTFTMQDLFVPDRNIQVGVKYIDFLNHQFKNNVPEVLAAYNAGQGNVAKWRQADIWDGTLGNVDKIPFWETRKYVERVDYYYKKYTHIYGHQSTK